VNEAYEKIRSKPIGGIKETTILNELLINREKYGVTTNDILGFMLGMIFAGIETVYFLFLAIINNFCKIFILDIN
jgi:hypothetical protein